MEPTIFHPWQQQHGQGLLTIPCLQYQSLDPEVRLQTLCFYVAFLANIPDTKCRRGDGTRNWWQPGDFKVPPNGNEVIDWNEWRHTGMGLKKMCRIQRQKKKRKEKTKMGRDGDGQACTGLLNHLLSLPGKHCAAWCWLYHCGSYERRQAEGFGEESRYGNWKEHTWRQIHGGLRGWDGWVSERKKKNRGREQQSLICSHSYLLSESGKRTK